MNGFKTQYYTLWDPEKSILITRLRGLISVNDVRSWIQGFEQAAKLIPSNSGFKLLSDLHGFTAENVEAHKAMRTIIPLFLSQHGMKPGFARLFPEVPVTVVTLEAKRCVASAHVHHDVTKITKYHTELSTASEDFFTDSDAAEKWLNAIHL
jgi:hypothetical protein